MKNCRKSIVQGFAQVYGYNFQIPQENINLLKELFIMKKWIKKEETSFRLAIKKLSEFTPEFQKVLIENAIAGGYQGLVFSNSKSEEQKYLKNELTKNSGSLASNISRLKEITAIRNNHK